MATSGVESVTLALMNDGSAWCWGDNRYGTCPTAVHGLLLTPTATNISCATQVSMYDNGGSLLLGNGKIAIWSAGANGQHGDPNGGLHDSSVPELLAGVPRMKRVVSAARSEFAITTNGELWWWGVFDKVSNAQLTPGPVAGLPSVKDVDASGVACAITTSGKLWCWGANDFGGLGDGTTTSRLEPKQVDGLDDVTAVRAVAFTCALTKAGEVWCWGLNDTGQLGAGGTPTPFGDPLPFVTMPQRVAGLPPIRGITAGFRAACAVDWEGLVYCWGETATYEQVPAYFTLPHVVPWLDHVEQVVLGNDHLCALKTDHTIWCSGGSFENGLGTETWGIGKVAIPGAP